MLANNILTMQAAGNKQTTLSEFGRGIGLSIDLWPLIVYTLIVFVIVGTMLGLSYILGQKRRDRATNEPFESGIVSVGDAHFRISVHFYLTAILFIIFDLEAIILFTWAIAVRQAGWLGYAEALVFILILLAGLVYLYKVGALDWRTQRQRGKRAQLRSAGGVINCSTEKKAYKTEAIERGETP